MRARVFGPVLFALACGREPASGGGTDTTGAVTAASTWGPGDGSTSAGDETPGSSGGDASGGDASGVDSSDSSSGDLPSDAPLALYVASGANLHHFEVDLATGTPQPVDVLPAGEHLGPMTHRSDLLFIGDLGARSVVVLSLAADGTPTSLGAASLDIEAVYLSLAAGGQHLLVADYGANRIASFAVDRGSIAEHPAAERNVGQNPHAIVPAPDGAFVFVPHLGSGEIRQYRYDDVSGALTPNEPAQVQAPTGGPRHLVFDATATHAYVGNEVDDSVTTWDYDAAAGQLSDPRTVSTLPGGMSDDANTVAELRLTPDGRFLYASNRGHDSLAIFAVEGGELTPLGHAATAPTPRAFTIEPGGRFIYVGGLGDGSLVTHVIADDGSLSEGAVIDVSPEPMWIEAVVR